MLGVLKKAHAPLSIAQVALGCKDAKPLAMWNFARWLQAVQRGLAARPRWFEPIGTDMMSIGDEPGVEPPEPPAAEASSSPQAAGVTGGGAGSGGAAPGGGAGVPDGGAGAGGVGESGVATATDGGSGGGHALADGKTGLESDDSESDVEEIPISGRRISNAPASAASNGGVWSDMAGL